MEYQISGTTMQTLEINLTAGESVFSQNAQMSWMTQQIELHTNMEGGLLAALARKFTGASFFIQEYTVNSGTGLVAFCPRFPGQIICKDLGPGESLICRKQSFLCAEHSVHLEAFFRQKLWAGAFGGEGFLLQKVTGPGKVFLDLSGEVVEKTLGPGETLRVHCHHVAVQDASVGFDIQMVKGFNNFLFGGQGIFVATLTGPGKVMLQSMPIELLAESLAAHLTSTSSDSSSSTSLLGGIASSFLK